MTRRVIAWAALLLIGGTVVGAFGVSPAGAAPAGDTVAGDTVAGDTVAGDTVGGDTVAQKGSGPRKVLVIAAPHLTWKTVDEERPPNLMELLERSSVASLSVRTVGPRTTAGAAYLTLGAGNRSATDPLVDGLVLERDESLTTGEPAALYQRSTGIEPTAPILALGLPQIRVENDAEHFGTEPGALASALAKSGRHMAVIGNADQTDDSPTFRQAALFGIDLTGQLAGGAVGRQLLEVDALSPFGVRLGTDATLAAFDAAWPTADVTLVEMSDLARAEASRATSTPEQGDRLFADSLAHDDEIVGRILDRVEASGEQVDIYLVGPDSPIAVEQLTVFAAAGENYKPNGLAYSSTTRRDGYVTLTDLAPTILDAWDVDVPESMSDTRISTTASSDTLDQRILDLVDSSERAVVRDEAFGVLTVIFVVVLVVDLVLAVICLARVRRLAPYVQVLALVVLFVPPISFLIGLLPVADMNTASIGLVLFGGALVVSWIAWALARWRERTTPPGTPTMPLPWYPVLATWAVLAADIVTGAHLQINTIFGYSPIVAGRFAGFGNQAFSMFAISALLLATGAFEVLTRPDERPRWFIPGVLVFFGITVVLDGYPGFGSDVGGVLAFVPAAAVCVLLLRGTRVRVRLLALITAATVVVIGVFAVIDLNRDPEQRTHLGRFVAKVFDGDAAEILERKVSANISVLNSIWSWVIPVALVYFVYLTWRPNKTLERLQREHRGFRPFGISGLLLGVLSMVLNDSGASMPAMMLAISLAYTTYLAIGFES